MSVYTEGLKSGASATVDPVQAQQKPEDTTNSKVYHICLTTRETSQAFEADNSALPHSHTHTIATPPRLDQNGDGFGYRFSNFGK